MTVRPIACLFMTAVPLWGASVDHRLDALERDVSELQSLVHALSQRSQKSDITPGKPVPTDSGNSHLVRTGDSYWSIARRHGVSITALERANPGINPRRLAIGKRIHIPGQTSLASDNNSTLPHQSAPHPGTYTVKPGDILGRISETHGIRLHQLLAANPGLDPRRLKIGTMLAIPGQTGPTKTPALKSPQQKKQTPVEAPKTVESYQPAPPPENSGILPSGPPESTALKSVDIPKTILVTVDKDMRLAEVANQHATSVAILNELNEVNLSPEQMIKTGSQLYVPDR